MIARRDLISEPYLEMQKILHAAPRGYGGRGDKWAGMVRHLIETTGATSVLDYGCGQGTLVAALAPMPGVRFSEYDPAIPLKDGPPTFADLVVCTDVLEHIEHDRLNAVLEHLRSLARRQVFVVISTKLTAKVLADGRNAHLTVKPSSWWKRKMEKAGFMVEKSPKIGQRKPEHEWVAVLTP